MLSYICVVLNPLCAGSYHEHVDTNGIEDVISSRGKVHNRAQFDASSNVDSFKNHRTINGGCLVQVHRK